jgi:flagellar M-ring protein FliF
MAANEQGSSASNLTGQARALWGRLPMQRRAIAVGVVAAVIGLTAWVTLREKTSEWATLFSRLPAEDSGELLGLLQGRGVAARIGGDGASIEVPPGRVAEARMMAASAGLPHGGTGFEVFDGRSFGQSSFVEQVNYRRALQGELARSISALSAVEGARVHIAMGKRSVFRDADEPPTASVALRLRPGQALEPSQVRGIVHLVAASVDGLTAERVSVIDQLGNVLSEDADATGAESGIDLEKQLAARVRGMLERVVGPGRVAVTASAQMDTRQVDSTEELYDKDSIALRSEGRTVEGAGDIGGIGGIAGSRANLPGAPAPTTTAAGAGVQRLQETKNYEVNRVVRHTIEAPVRIGKMHVAVLVDYQRGADGVPVARSADELAQLTSLARQAAGIDEVRGDSIEVRSVPFIDQAEPAIDAEPAPAASSWPLPVSLPVLIAAGGGLLLFGAVAFMMLGARRRRRRRVSAQVISLPARVHEVQAALDEPGQLGGAPRSALALGPLPLHERVQATVRADTAHAARVLSRWLEEAKAEPGKNEKAA